MNAILKFIGASDDQVLVFGGSYPDGEQFDVNERRSVLEIISGAGKVECLVYAIYGVSGCWTFALGMTDEWEWPPDSMTASYVPDELGYGLNFILTFPDFSDKELTVKLRK